jgi:hypothetical protein
VGQKISDVFESVVKEGGLAMRMRLSLIVGLPSAKAMETPDSPEMLQKLADAYKEVTGKVYKG